MCSLSSVGGMLSHYCWITSQVFLFAKTGDGTRMCIHTNFYEEWLAKPGINPVQAQFCKVCACLVFLIWAA